MAGRGQLVSWTEDILFTRLDIHDPHWKISRKTLARAFSADEIRRAQFRVQESESILYWYPSMHMERIGLLRHHCVHE